MRERSEELESFISTVSHDLRGPINQISEFSRLLMERVGPKIAADADAQTYVNFIQANRLKIDRMFEALGYYYQLIKHEPNNEPVLTKDILNETLSKIEEVTPKAKSYLSYKYVPEKIYGDRALLLQLFFHLISNALKFHKPNTDPKVEIIGTDNGRFWNFSVIDSGIGIPSNLHEKVFKFFHMLEPHAENAGAGAGLTLSKEIVEAHGGEIWIDDAVSEGTTVYFTIPKKECNEE